MDGQNASLDVGLDNYVELVCRTENRDFRRIGDRLTEVDTIRLLHAAVGMCTETGEFQDALKRYIFYGKPIDAVNLMEEMGDIMYYVALAHSALEIRLKDTMERNIMKLAKRYPNGFTGVSALSRNLVAERETLEGRGKDGK